jgi:hypothetical protein
MLKNLFYLHCEKLLNKKYIIVVLSGILAIAIFFRVQLYSYGKWDLGDNLDGLIAFSIIHHWYNFFHGIESWRTVGYFYPYVNTLGYNDGYFLYGVIYTVLRFLKVRMFIASEGVNVIIRMIGFYSFFYLCYRKLDLNFFVCLLTAFIFSLSTIVYQQGGHVQLLSVSFAPLLTIFIINYLKYLLVDRNIYRSIFWGCITGTFYAAWLLTAFYMVWFYTLFSAILLLLVCIYQYCYHFFPLKKPSLIGVLFPLTVTTFALIPFLITYLPLAHQTGMHDYSEIRFYTPGFLNIINIGNQNLVWGSIIKFFHMPEGEAIVGYPLFFLIVLSASIIYCLKNNQNDVFIFYRLLAFALIISFLISISFMGHSLWYFIYHFFPGGKGLRVVYRYWIYLVFPMCVLLTYYLSKRIAWSFSFLCFIIPILLILEQINIGSATHLNTKKEQDFVNSIKAIPHQCRSFFVTGSRYGKLEPSWSVYWNNVDAMLISEITGIRTINGFSTFVPPDWNFNSFPSTTYLERVKIYAYKHDINGTLCLFDIHRMKWNVFPQNLRNT